MPDGSESLPEVDVALCLPFGRSTETRQDIWLQIRPVLYDQLKTPMAWNTEGFQTQTIKTAKLKHGVDAMNPLTAYSGNT